MSFKPKSRSSKFLPNSRSIDCSIHNTSGDDVTKSDQPRGRFRKQRSVTDVFNYFVGAKRFRNLVARMTRQRRHASSPNVSRESSDIPESEMSGTPSMPKLTEQQAQVRIDRAFVNQDYVNKTRISQTRLDKISVTSCHVDNTHTPQMQADNNCTTWTNVDNACTIQTRVDKPFVTQSQIHNACTSQIEVQKTCRVRAENEAVLRLLVNREQQMKRALPGTATLPRCEPGATRGQQVRFPVIDRGNMVSSRQHSRRASLTAMPSVEDRHSHNNTYLIKHSEDGRPNSISNMHLCNQTGDTSIGSMNPCNLTGDRRPNSIGNMHLCSEAGDARTIGHTPRLVSSDSIRSESLDLIDKSVSQSSNAIPAKSRSPGFNGIHTNYRDPIFSGIHTNYRDPGFSGIQTHYRDPDVSGIHTSYSHPAGFSGSLTNPSDEHTASYNSSFSKNQNCDNNLQPSTYNCTVTRGGESSAYQDCDNQLKLSTKCIVTHAGDPSPSKEEGEKLQTVTDSSGILRDGGLSAVDDGDNTDNTQQTHSASTNANYSDIDMTATSTSPECNAGEVGTVRRKSVSHSFGRYVGKQAGRFRDLVLRLNLRSHHRHSTSNDVSSSEQHTSTQNKGKGSRKHKRTVSRSYHHSDFMLYSDSVDACDDDDSDADEDHLFGMVCGGDTANESQPMLNDSNDHTPKYQPTYSEMIYCNTEEEKKEIQECEKDNNGVLYKPCIDSVNDRKDSQNCDVLENKLDLRSTNLEVDTIKHGTSESCNPQQCGPMQQCGSLQEFDSPQFTEDAGEEQQIISVLESDLETAKPTVTTNEKKILIRSLSLNPDKYSHFMNVSDECESHREADVDDGQRVEREVKNVSKRKHHSRKKFYKQFSFDRLAMFVTKRSGHFRKLFTKTNRNDSACTVVQSSDVNTHSEIEVSMLETEDSNQIPINRHKCSSGVDDCLTSSYCTNSNQILTTPSKEIPQAPQQYQVNIEPGLLIDSKHMHNGNYTVGLQNGSFSPESNNCTLGKKDENEGTECLTVSCNQIILEIKSDEIKEKVTLKQNTTNLNLLHATESIPAHLDVVDEVDAKKRIEKSKSCSPTFLRSNFVEHPDFSQILTFLSLGSIETASNGHLLCKLGIDSLIDISSASFEALNQQRMCYPCLCSKRNHFRSRLNINIEDIEWENIEEHFKDINTFIEGARLSEKSVLVYSYHGNSRAAALVVQYLMRHFRMSLTSAYNLVTSRRPSVCVNPGFQKALKRLESKLFIEWEKSDSSCQLDISKYLLKPATRQAWTESFDNDD